VYARMHVRVSTLTSAARLASAALAQQLQAAYGSTALQAGSA